MSAIEENKKLSWQKDKETAIQNNVSQYFDLYVRMSFMIKKIIFLGLLSSILLTGCVKNNRQAGILFGGVAGGLLGSTLSDSDNKTLGTAFGAVIGSIIGAEIGQRMDKEDKARHERAFHKATHSQVGEKITWTNPHSGNYGQVTVLASGEDKAGHTCKKVSQMLTIDGELYEKTTTICRVNDEWSVTQ
jgi:surface antigen